MAQTIGERFSFLRQELKELQTKEIQFEIDLQQHERVLETIAKLEDSRKCYRLVGEVLVQSTISEARPEIETQRNRLKDLVDSFRQKIDLKEKEIIQFQNDNHIQMRSVEELEQMKKK